MKMVTAIVNRKDAGEVCRSLTEAGCYFTQMASTGGFLNAGNTTLLLGTEEGRGDEGGHSEALWIPGNTLPLE